MDWKLLKCVVFLRESARRGRAGWSWSSPLQCLPQCGRWLHSSAVQELNMVGVAQEQLDLSNPLAKWTLRYPSSGALVDGVPSRFLLNQEHLDGIFPVYPGLIHKKNTPKMEALTAALHKDIEAFCSKVAVENATRRTYIYSAITQVTRSLQVLWPECRIKTFGSIATGLALPSSDADLVVHLPTEFGNKGRHLQLAARHLAKQDWVTSGSIETVENTRVPVIMLSADFSSISNPPFPRPNDPLIRLDLSFQSITHTGILTVQLMKGLVAEYPQFKPLVLVLKQFLVDREIVSLSSYCLGLLITRFLQHQYHLGRHSQDLGSSLMGFLHFFGCVFDPQRTCISVRGAGMYMNRDPFKGTDLRSNTLLVEDPLHPMENAAGSCTSFLQCSQAFAEAYYTLLKELDNTDKRRKQPLLQRVVPSF